FDAPLRRRSVVPTPPGDSQGQPSSATAQVVDHGVAGAKLLCDPHRFLVDFWLHAFVRSSRGSRPYAPSVAPEQTFPLVRRPGTGATGPLTAASSQPHEEDPNESRQARETDE